MDPISFAVYEIETCIDESTAQATAAETSGDYDVAGFFYGKVQAYRTALRVILAARDAAWPRGDG